MPAMDYSKLRGRTVEMGYTQCDVAKYIGITAATYSQKLNGKSEFSQNEIQGIVQLLQILPSEISAYFFTAKV